MSSHLSFGGSDEGTPASVAGEGVFRESPGEGPCEG